MSDEYYEEVEDDSDLESGDEELEVDDDFDAELDLEEDADLSDDPDPVEDDSFEEITSDEVDHVIASLETLLEGVQSENVRTHLETAVNKIFYLVYNDDDLEEEDGELSAEAA